MQRAQQEALDQAQAAGREAGPDWEATSLPPQPANPAAQAVRDDRSSAVSTLHPDPDDIGSREEMLRLRAGPPPWFPDNPKRWVVIYLEYYTLSGPYDKGEGDTITYLYNTCTERQSHVGFTREDLATVVRVVGKGNKKRAEILWPRGIAWAHMTHSGDTAIWDVKGVFMPMTGPLAHLVPTKYIKLEWTPLDVKIFSFPNEIRYNPLRFVYRRIQGLRENTVPTRWMTLFFSQSRTRVRYH